MTPLENEAWGYADTCKHCTGCNCSGCYRDREAAFIAGARWLMEWARDRRRVAGIVGDNDVRPNYIVELADLERAFEEEKND